MINLYGVDFHEHEVDIVNVNGEPTWVVNTEGMRRLILLKPDCPARQDFLDLVDQLERGGQGAA